MFALDAPQTAGLCISDSQAQIIGLSLIASWGLLALTLGLVAATNFHGAADWGARMARFGRQPTETQVRSYRNVATIFATLGVLAVVFALAGFIARLV